MTGSRKIALFTVGLAIISLFGCARNRTTVQPTPGATRTALDEYVHRPDPAFRYERVRTIEGDGYDAHVLRMVSQRWRTEDEVNRTEWWHWLIVAVPDRVDHQTGFLYIGGGDNEDAAPDSVNPLIANLAVNTNSVVAELRMVPNQPLVFADDGEERYEDAIIAYTWDKYMRTGDEYWPLRMPMTKSAVRAMDAITQYCGSNEGPGVVVDRYVVAGGSKRGWTTWTTAAVDTRVLGIMPIVIDLLNVEASFEHHYRAYGYYAPAVIDYERMGIMDWAGRPEYRALLELVEPYEYRSRYTLPKFLINSTGDQFFLPDSAQFYFDDLPGEKYLRYVPNADHGLGGSDARESVLAYYYALLNNIPRPRFSWSKYPDGGLKVFTLDDPLEVRLWRATNPKKRIFRKDTIGEAYTSIILDEQAYGEYYVEAPTPEEGYTAYFIELTYASGGPAPFKFTTPVYVTPDIYEHDPYEPDTSILPPMPR